MKDKGGAAFCLLAAGLPGWRPAAWRCLLAGVAAVAAPKCFLCVAGYVAVLTGLGWAGPELCGTEAGPRMPWIWAGITSGLTAWMVFRLGRKIAD